MSNDIGGINKRGLTPFNDYTLLSSPHIGCVKRFAVPIQLKRFYRATPCVSAVFAVVRGPSVCLSRWWIVSRRLKISSNLFLGPVASSFQLLKLSVLSQFTSTADSEFLLFATLLLNSCFLRYSPDSGTLLRLSWATVRGYTITSHLFNSA